MEDLKVQKIHSSEHSLEDDDWIDATFEEDRFDFGDIILGHGEVQAISANVPYFTYNNSIYGAPMESVLCWLPAPNVIIPALIAIDLLKLPANSNNLKWPLYEFHNWSMF